MKKGFRITFNAPFILCFALASTFLLYDFSDPTMQNLQARANAALGELAAAKKLADDYRSRIRRKGRNNLYPNVEALLCRLALDTPAMIEDVLRGDDRLLMRTVIGLLAGGDNYGISASEGCLNQTLRGHRQADIDALIDRIESVARVGCEAGGMACRFERHDPFPDTTNDDALYDDVLRRFRAAGLPVSVLDEPMRWSEDCGHLLKAVPGVFFGIGAGEDSPGLHTESYAFDDALIAPAVRAFEALL